MNNQQLTINNSDFERPGFSLFEILVVISIFAVLLLILAQSLFSTFRQSAKSEVLRGLRESGDYAASIMERSLHSAETIENCTGEYPIVSYRNSEGVSASFSCLDIGRDSGHIASSSAGLSVPLTGSSVKLTSCSISCDLAQNPPLVSISATIAPSGEGSERYNFSTDIVLRSR